MHLLKNINQTRRIFNQMCRPVLAKAGNLTQKQTLFDNLRENQKNLRF
jgi:hypothetical protein